MRRRIAVFGLVVTVLLPVTSERAGAGPVRDLCRSVQSKVAPNRGPLRDYHLPRTLVPLPPVIVTPNLGRLLAPDMPGDKSRSALADQIRRLCDATKKGE